MKQIVKPSPKHPHMLMLNGGEVVQDHRPSVVTEQDYLQARIAKGEIKVLEGELPEEANDSDFEKFWEKNERNDKKAIAEFLGSLMSKRSEEKKSDDKK